MPAARPVLRVGLTGGIASGKSTVAEFLRELGARVVDGDRLAHEVMEPGAAAHDAVVARFGRGILDEAGRIDRGRLGPVVFADAEARAALNAIVHPAVRAAAWRRMDAPWDPGALPIAVFDAALLVETGAWRQLHRLVVTRCSPETQLRRLLERGLARDDAAARIAAQAPLADKLAAAHYVIETDTTLEETRRQTEEVWDFLVSDQAQLERPASQPD